MRRHLEFGSQRNQEDLNQEIRNQGHNPESHESGGHLERTAVEVLEIARNYQEQQVTASLIPGFLDS
jgi:hypothetical protein